MDSQPAKAVIDRISIVQMQERYGLSTRQAVYDRLKKLDIKPVRGTIDTETELPQMDRLHEESQTPKSALSSVSTGQIQKSSRQLDNQLALQPEMLMTLLEMLRPQQPEPSAIASLRERLELLELCAQQGNTLSTSELGEVLGLKPDSLRDKKRHSQYGYSFSRAGKHSHELAWKIEKAYP